MDTILLPHARATCLVLLTISLEVDPAAQEQSWEQRSSSALLCIMVLEQTLFQG